MDALTSASGSLAVAISALLLVMGFRLARPARAREWVALAAYAAALAVQTLGALGLLGEAPVPPAAGLRVAGAIALVAGILLAGTPARERRRAAISGAPLPPPRRGIDPVYAGLALVTLGQLLRGPSRAGAVAVAVAALVAAWVAFTPRPRERVGEVSSR